MRDVFFFCTLTIEHKGMCGRMCARTCIVQGRLIAQCFLFNLKIKCNTCDRKRSGMDQPPRLCCHLPARKN